MGPRGSVGSIGAEPYREHEGIQGIGPRGSVGVDRG